MIKKQDLNIVLILLLIFATLNLRMIATFSRPDSFSLTTFMQLKKKRTQGTKLYRTKVVLYAMIEQLHIKMKRQEALIVSTYLDVKGKLLMFTCMHLYALVSIPVLLVCGNSKETNLSHP